VEFDVDAYLSVRRKQSTKRAIQMSSAAFLAPWPKIWNSPLALGHCRVDAFVVDAGGEQRSSCFFPPNNLAGNVADVRLDDAGVSTGPAARIGGGREARDG